MTSLIEIWGEDALTDGHPTIVSPSGHAVAFVSANRRPYERCIEIRFSDGRPSVVFEDDHFNGIKLIGWASDDEIVYWVADDWEVYDTPPALYVYSLDSGTSRHVMDWFDDPICASGSGESRSLTLLTEHGGKAAIYDLDIDRGKLRRRTEFDAALDRLEVYPKFGCSFSRTHQEMAVVAWPIGDYRHDSTHENAGTGNGKGSRRTWLPPYSVVRPNGAWVSASEMSEEASRRLPPRLCLLSREGGWREVPNSYLAKRPQWLPDGSGLLFEKQNTGKAIQYSSEWMSLWLMNGTNLSSVRLGDCFLDPTALVHPSGVAFVRLFDDSIPLEIDDGKERFRSRRWQEVRFEWE